MPGTIIYYVRAPGKRMGPRWQKVQQMLIKAERGQTDIIMSAPPVTRGISRLSKKRLGISIRVRLGCDYATLR